MCPLVGTSLPLRREPESNAWFMSKLEQPQSLRSPHNLHTVYEEFTGLECLLGKVEAREDAKTFHLISGAGHEEHSPPSVPVHDLSLARHIDHSSDSDIANDARTSHLSSSMDEL
jgi:hypothetical protein